MPAQHIVNDGCGPFIRHVGHFDLRFNLKNLAREMG